MTTRRTRLAPLAILATALIAGACGGEASDERDEMDESMPMGDMGGQMPQMEIDPQMMRRHAEEGDAMAAELREHLAEMRGLPAEAQHARMGEHVGTVSRMLSLMNRQMREMSMGMPMDDEQMGAMMGMTGAEHRRMMEEMGALRAELEELQVAPVAVLRERMPRHLERVEVAVEMLEYGARHMRRM